MDQSPTAPPLILMASMVRMINHCGRALVNSGEPLPNPNWGFSPSEFLTRLRRVARARRLPHDGLTAFEKVCAIWEPATQRFAEGKTPLTFSDHDSLELAAAIKNVERWLSTNFPTVS